MYALCLRGGSLALLSALIAGCSTPPTPASEDSRLLRLAKELSERGDPASAVVLYERAAQASGHTPDLMLALGQARLRNGDAAGASQAFREVIEQRPDDAQALLGLGAAALREGRAQRAVGLLADAAPRVDSAQGYNLWGVAALMHGDAAQAEAAFGLALAKAPQDLDLQTNLALSQALDGNHAAAMTRIEAVTASALAQPHHVRRQALILMLAGQPKRAKAVLGDLPPGRRKALLSRARYIAALKDTAARARAIGIMPGGPGDTTR
ncbi:tetratricopeptide repeat protein [Bordetella genomosp. 7]|uniref:tetratricopeptide repeat protein n=1 Tax=Bordetella genomosp. 7 TaxID=1416805 RepID=UPI001482D694|nr:tetratricopeptide repeat protein [Bordetella genomosp. 7]